MFSFSKLVLGGASILGGIGGLSLNLFSWESKNSIFDKKKIENLEKEELNILKELEELLKKFSSSLEFIESRKSSESEKIKDLFEEISKFEEKLTVFLNKNISSFEELQKIFEELDQSIKEELQRQEVLQEINAKKKLYEQFKEKVATWGASISSLSCALENNSDNSNTCLIKSAEEYKKQFESNNIEKNKTRLKRSTNSGGGESITKGQEAQKKLKDIEEKISTISEELKKNYLDNKSKLDKESQGSQIANLWLKFSQLEKKTLEKLFSSLKEQIEKVSRESETVINDLNKKYRDLGSSNWKWELLKQQSNIFHKYIERINENMCSKNFSQEIKEKFCNSKEKQVETS